MKLSQVWMDSALTLRSLILCAFIVFANDLSLLAKAKVTLDSSYLKNFCR